MRPTVMIADFATASPTTVPGTPQAKRHLNRGDDYIANATTYFYTNHRPFVHNFCAR